MTINELNEIYKNFPHIINKGILIRKIEERLLRLFEEGKLNGTVHTCIGQELIGPIVEHYLNVDDWMISNHRGHGHYIAKTDDVEGLIAEVMGRTTGVCKGYGGSQHLFSKGFISNGIQGGMTPIASGLGLSFKLMKKDNIVVIFIGDGTLGQGIIYEAFNICSIWNIPVVFVLENNQYAQSTPQSLTFSGDIIKRVEGFGMKYFHSDTWDIFDLDTTAKNCVNYTRGEKRPSLLEITTYRLKSHSKGDDNRNTTEIISYNKKDILSRFLTEKTDKISEVLLNVDERISNAVTLANEAPVLENIDQRKENFESANKKEISFIENTKRFNDMIFETLKQRLKSDSNSIFIGEDIQYTTNITPVPYGGAFKVSKDLSQLFPDRVLNTPISESAIIGIGTGLAIGGMKPIVEVMFGDFMTLAFDQIFNHASKFCNMFGKTIAIPLIIRTPMGGKRGYGPTHSQSIEKHFFGIPNLNIVALNYRIPADLIYKSIFKENSPTLVIENKVLYTRHLATKHILGYRILNTIGRYPEILIQPDDKYQPDITIICYGGLLEEVEDAIQKAFYEDEILCEVVCPSLINPINPHTIIESAKKTGKILVIEEGSNIGGFGSEIASILLENNVNTKVFVKMGNNSIIPCSIIAEQNLLPNVKSIYTNIINMCNGN